MWRIWKRLVRRCPLIKLDRSFLMDYLGMGSRCQKRALLSVYLSDSRGSCHSSAWYFWCLASELLTLNIRLSLCTIFPKTGPLARISKMFIRSSHWVSQSPVLQLLETVMSKNIFRWIYKLPDGPGMQFPSEAKLAWISYNFLQFTQFTPEILKAVNL